MFIFNKKKNRKPVIPPTDNVLNIKYDYYHSMYIGKRNEQQDYLSFLDGMNSDINFDFLGILCDGMGGLEDGKFASNETVSYIKQRALALKNINYTNLLEMTLGANSNLLSKKHPHQNIGTTLLITAFNQGMLYWSCIGDSKIYLIRENKIMPINHQHNYRLELLESVSREESNRESVFTNIDGHKLTSFIGIETLKQIDISKTPFKLKKSDIILLCSDGLFDTLSDKEILSTVTKNFNEFTAISLIQEAIKKSKPYQDNISTLIIKYRGD